MGYYDRIQAIIGSVSCIAKEVLIIKKRLPKLMNKLMNRLQSDVSQKRQLLDFVLNEL